MLRTFSVLAIIFQAENAAPNCLFWWNLNTYRQNLFHYDWENDTKHVSYVLSTTSSWNKTKCVLQIGKGNCFNTLSSWVKQCLWWFHQNLKSVSVVDKILHSWKCAFLTLGENWGTCFSTLLSWVKQCCWWSHQKLKPANVVDKKVLHFLHPVKTVLIMNLLQTYLNTVAST